jgi:hypothetical protein
VSAVKFEDEFAIFNAFVFVTVSASQSWIIVHFIGHAFAYLFMCYIMIQVQELFVPIAAKQYYSNPDVMIALISVLWMTLTMSYFVRMMTAH